MPKRGCGGDGARGRAADRTEDGLALCIILALTLAVVGSKLAFEQIQNHFATVISSGILRRWLGSSPRFLPKGRSDLLLWLDQPIGAMRQSAVRVPRDIGLELDRPSGLARK
jgi:hypothetical protein